ncbi:MAG: 3-hydroxybutyryl-CoA dehydrogenase [Planctomycetes bacterium]|nr:3-hydroxybutyryl-CoA dehydrogenase [Planctomycetota bacterium]
MTAKPPIGVLGSGTMGVGIAQVAAAAGHPVVLLDAEPPALTRARSALETSVRGQVAKGRLPAPEGEALIARVALASEVDAFRGCGLVIEAITENLGAKRAAFARLEPMLAADCLLASNTSSLSIAALALGLTAPQRFLGAHFFNPAPAMPLVEVVPGLDTAPEALARAAALITSWGKTTVIAQDTPGFIVNRIARPFYGEALRQLDEGIADVATIDWAMRELGGFRMGPFELMDLIGNDVNYQVTETIFAGFYGDARFRPSVTQKRLVEAGRLGRKSGRGFYDHREGAARPEALRDSVLGQRILLRILVMLINEAADALHLRIASAADIDLAMTTGVNYPKGPLRWADELGARAVVDELARLRDEYGEERYRPHPLLKRMAQEGRRFRD